MSQAVEIIARGRDEGASRMLDDVNRKIDKLGSGGTAAGGKFSGGLGRLTNSLAMTAGMFAELATLQNLIIAGGGAKLAQAFIEPATAMETWTVQLGVLLGGEKQAAGAMAELSRRAATTPFQLANLVEAYRTLQVFTGGALNAEGAFQQIGNAAAGTGARFEEVAYWTGRLYSALKNKTPFLDAVGALQRIGVLGGDVRPKLEAMVKTSASFDKQWQLVTEDMARFDGMMARLSETTNGRISTMKDNWAEFAREVGKGLLPAVNSAVDDATGGLMDANKGGAGRLLGKTIAIPASVTAAIAGTALSQWGKGARGISGAFGADAGGVGERGKMAGMGLLDLLTIIPRQGIAGAKAFGGGIISINEVTVVADSADAFAATLPRAVGAPQQ